MRPHHPKLGTADEIVRLLEHQAKQQFVERPEGASPSPWSWLQEVLPYEPPEKQAELGEALSRLLALGDYATSYALDQVYRCPSAVLAPIWQHLGTIGPELLDIDLPESNDDALAALLRYLLAAGQVPALPDDAIDFLLGLSQRDVAWPLGLLVAAASRPDEHSATLARAIGRMSDPALEEVIMSMMVKPVPFMAQGIDAMAALPDADRKRFAATLKRVTDQRDRDRAYLLSTTSDPARRQRILDAGDYDVKMGLDWPSLEARLRP